MPKYRKKPVVIEAVQYDGSDASAREALAFAGTDAAQYQGGELLIVTLEGMLHASPGDWIVKGIKGEFYPCKPDIFSATYEPADA